MKVNLHAILLCSVIKLFLWWLLWKSSEEVQNGSFWVRCRLSGQFYQCNRMTTASTFFASFLVFSFPTLISPLLIFHSSIKLSHLPLKFRGKLVIVKAFSLYEDQVFTKIGGKGRHFHFLSQHYNCLGIVGHRGVESDNRMIGEIIFKIQYPHTPSYFTPPTHIISQFYPHSCISLVMLASLPNF